MLNEGNRYAVDVVAEGADPYTLKDPHQVCAIAVGEWLALGPAQATLAFLGDQPDAVESLDGNHITFGRAGRFEVRVALGLTSAVVPVLVYEADLLDRVHVKDDIPGTTVGGLKRRVLRELARWEPRFDGTKDTFFNFNITHYGASPNPTGGVVPA